MLLWLMNMGFGGGMSTTYAPNLGRTAFVARSARTTMIFPEDRTAKAARDPGDAIIPEQ